MTTMSRDVCRTSEAGGAGAPTGNPEAFSVNDFKTLMYILNIDLPDDALNENVIKRSENPEVMADAEVIKKKLENVNLQLDLKPRISCGKVAHIMELKQQNNAQGMTTVLFFKACRDSEESLKQHWKNNVPVSCEFQLNPTYQEISTHPGVPNGPKTDMRFREFGFLSGRDDFSGCGAKEHKTSHHFRDLVHTYITQNGEKCPNENTKEIEELDIFCKNEALPRFLAVLKLIFKKVRHFTIEDYNQLLEILQIKLPEGLLIPEVMEHAKNCNVIKDAKYIIERLQNGKLQLNVKPRLRCEKIKVAQLLRNKDEAKLVTRMIFFKPQNEGKRTSLKEFWENQTSNFPNRFRLRNTYRECFPDVETKVPSAEQVNEKQQCLKFFIREEDLKDVHYKQAPRLEFELLSGNSDFQVNAKDQLSNEQQEIILLCKQPTHNPEENVHKIRARRWAELNEAHQDYYTTMGCQYILQKTQHTSGRAAVVIAENC